MEKSSYFKQVRLILRTIPHMAVEKRFALKGGTALNLFVREMPRLSVDIDLSWLPLQPRDIALEHISLALSGIAERIRGKVPGATVHETCLSGTKQVVKLVVSDPDAMIKIEPNLVLRGTVFPHVERELCTAAKQFFELTVTAPTLSVPDLYGGKLCACLDRQHPRDIFDIMLLMEHEGITNDIRMAFVVYLASHHRPMSELLDPGKKDFLQTYDREFAGMPFRDVAYGDLLNARDLLIQAVRQDLTESERLFLLSIKQAQPNWALLPVTGIDQLPAIRWKLLNIQKMTLPKRKKAIEKLRRLLGV